MYYYNTALFFFFFFQIHYCVQDCVPWGRVPNVACHFQYKILVSTYLCFLLQHPNSLPFPCVETPPMMGPTWSRVAYALGLDCPPVVSQDLSPSCCLVLSHHSLQSSLMHGCTSMLHCLTVWLIWCVPGAVITSPSDRGLACWCIGLLAWYSVSYDELVLYSL